jgi:hypothetical protein
MNFLQPFMFWGALAIAIPIAIHFLHQKRGKQLDWAAMQWLMDNSQQQSRGFRFDDLLLLLVRCLIFLLLTFLLSQPVLNWMKSTERSDRVHLVEPSAYLVDNYRFELESAMQRGEKVYWIRADDEEVKDLSSVSALGNTGSTPLQALINRVGKPGTKLDLYLLNDQKLLELPRIYISNEYTLYTAIDSSRNYRHNYLDLGAGKKLWVSQGKLNVSAQSESTPWLASKPVHAGQLKILVDFKNKAEKQTVEAALNALSSVYNLPFNIDHDAGKDHNYDWILTDQEVNKTQPTCLYVLSGVENGGLKNQPSNVVQLPDSLRIQTSEMVKSGQLPEFLGDLLVSHFNLAHRQGSLSQQQFNAIFVKVNPVDENGKGNIRKWLLLWFIILVMLERWMVLRKTIHKNYV